MELSKSQLSRANRFRVLGDHTFVIENAPQDLLIVRIQRNYSAICLKKIIKYLQSLISEGYNVRFYTTRENIAPVSQKYRINQRYFFEDIDSYPFDYSSTGIHLFLYVDGEIERVFFPGENDDEIIELFFGLF
jgi:hypothetical protein